MDNSGMRYRFKDSGKLVRRWQLRLKLTLGLFCALATSSAYSASKPILVLGDSLSAEYGLIRGQGWVTLLQARLAEQKIDAPILNASISGETTSGGLARLPVLLQQHPAIVIIELGGNDGLRGLPLASAESNFKSMIDLAQKAKAKVVLVGMQIPPNYGPDYTQKFAALYPKLATDSKSALVPFLLTGLEDKPQLFQADHIHPVAAAEPTLLNNVWPVLKPLLSK